MSLDPAVHLHELRCSGCRVDLGSIHRREDASREVVGFFYPPGDAALGETAVVTFLQAVQRSGDLPGCPACGAAVHEGCLSADLAALQPRRHRKKGRRPDAAWKGPRP